MEIDEQKKRSMREDLQAQISQKNKDREKEKKNEMDYDNLLKQHAER